jgi:dinuclear metal center YbgI/SA1388 family protein
MAASSEQTVQEIIQRLDARTPPRTAEDWDNVGLLVGDPAWKTAGAVVSIDLTPEAISAAQAKGYSLIVNHHPCIFPRSKGLSRVTAQPGNMGGLVFEALRKGIAVYCTHTNFDQCALEVPQQVSQALGLKPLGRLIEKGGRGSLVKLVVFVPETHAEAVREALVGAGAGRIGRYDSCTFSTRGEGTFRAGEGTQPFLGSQGQLERAPEVRLEAVLPRGLENSVLKAVQKAHPYEEVAYDLVPVEQGPVPRGLNAGIGYGVYGDLVEPQTFPELARHVRSAFQVEGFLASSPGPKRIQRIGFVAGKGASFVSAAVAAGCDLFITGEAGYHTALEASRSGMGVWEVGHRESEIFFLKTLAGWLRSDRLDCEVLNTPTQQIVTESYVPPS